MLSGGKYSICQRNKRKREQEIRGKKGLFKEKRITTKIKKIRKQVDERKE